MNAEQLIESYVSDVVRLLPRRLRGDVAVELRELLREELAGRVADRIADRGGAPDGATTDDAMALLTGFGGPAEVAARYRPTFNIIDPEDSRSFLKASVVGVALIWLIGLIETFRDRQASVGDALLALREFYLGVGLPSLMWPGLLVVWFGLAAWTRRRWPRSDDFVRLRGPVVLGVITALLVLETSVLIRGRWETATRRAQVVLNVVTAGVLLWVLFGGAIFTEPGADQLVRTVIGILVLTMLVGLALRLRRHRLTAAATHP